MPKGSARCDGHAASKRPAYADTTAKAPAQTAVAEYASNTAYKQIATWSCCDSAARVDIATASPVQPTLLRRATRLKHPL